jgi:solute carrier family 25 protein 34/35
LQVKGLFRGGSSAVPRAFVGSTSQLTSFAYCKEFMRKYDILTNSPLLMTFTASMVGGVAISLMMTPFDLVSTRLYNQGVDQFGKGLLYNGYTDCVLKIWKTEGFLGFYKGLGPSYFRLGPHTVLCLVFWDEFKELYSRIKPSNKY